MVEGKAHDRPVRSAWKYNIPVAIVAVLGTALSVGAWAYQRDRITSTADAVATASVTNVGQRASQKLGQISGSMESFQGLFAAGPDVSEQAFRAFARRTVGGPGRDVRMVGYSPLISAQYGELPIRFVYPASKQDTWSGVELQRIPGLETGIESARDEGETHIEELPPGPTNVNAQLVALTPLYRGGVVPATAEERRLSWTGMVSAYVPVSVWMGHAAAEVDPEDIALILLKVSGDGTEPVWSNGALPIDNGTDNWVTRSVLQVSPDEQYVLAGEPTPALVAAQGWWRPWAVLALGLLLTAATCIVLYRWLGARRIRRTTDDLEAATNRLLFLAEKDPLTRLPHRDGLLSWLDAWDEKDPERALGICFVDIDGFKEVNTAWGHPTGDFALRQIGQRLGVFADSNDCVVARLGGDEFVVMRALDRGSLDGLANMVQTVISEPIPMGDQRIQLTSSMGIVVRPEDGRALDTLLTNADIALRSAKREAGDSVVHYDPMMAAEGAAHRQMAAALRLALLDPDEHFFLQYQPQIDMRTRRLVGAEALVRWRDESGQLISPAEFIPLASEYGLMDNLGLWVLEQACDTVAEWRTTTDAVVSVNVDATQLDDGFSHQVARVMRQRGIQPEWIVLEVTESAAMSPQAKGELDRLRDLGVSLSIDDFGTGYSSLSRLAELPVHELKIDQVFVNNLTESQESQEIVRTVVALSAALELQTLAEGVETEQQAQILLAQGVHVAQGYLFSKPVSDRQCYRLWQTGVPAQTDSAKH